MSPIVLAIVLTTLPLVLLGSVSGLRRRTIAATVVIAVAVVGGALGNVLVVSDLWVLPMASGMAGDLGLLLLWAVLGAVVRAGGPLTIPGPPILVALISGACLGEVPAAAILSAGAKTRSGAARLALAAAGGGLLGRVGDPAVLLISSREPGILLYLAPLGILLALMAAPRRQDMAALSPGGGRRTLLLIAIAGAACVPGWTLWAVLAGIVIGLIQIRGDFGRMQLAHVVWTLAAVIVGLVAIAGGTPEMAATGLETIGEQLGSWGPAGLALAGAVLAALTDGTAAAVCSLGILDRAMSLQIPGAPLGMAAGLAVGGLGPLLAAGALKAGWKRWALQVVIAVLFVWVVTP